MTIVIKYKIFEKNEPIKTLFLLSRSCMDQNESFYIKCILHISKAVEKWSKRFVSHSRSVAISERKWILIQTVVVMQLFQLEIQIGNESIFQEEDATIKWILIAVKMNVVIKTNETKLLTKIISPSKNESLFYSLRSKSF